MNMDIIKEKIYNGTVICGLATGYDFNNRLSFFETEKYDQDHVKSSRLQFEEIIKNDYHNKELQFYYQNQKHSDIVIKINDKNLNYKCISDAIITDRKSLILNVSIADCTAILIYDKVNIAIAAVHSGRRGTNKKIVNKTLKKMNLDFGPNMKDVFTIILPSASKKKYEVGKEFINYFPKSTFKMNDKYFYSNQGEITNQLYECGIAKENIKINNDCTISNTRFHSYRRDGINAGRMNAYIGIID